MRVRRRAWTPVAAVVPLLLGSAAWGPLAAQTVRGYVLDDSMGTPLPDVVVSVVRDGERVRGQTTDSTGHFAFTLGDSATVRLEGRRLGWRTVLSRPVSVPARDTVTVELWMGIRAVPLSPLVVTARSDLGRSRFHRHMEEWGRGVFLTPAMVDSIDPIHPVDVLRGQEETWLSWRQGERRQLPNIRTYLGSGCVKFMLDRMEVRRWDGGTDEVAGAAAFEESILEHLQGREIVAVEYYRYIGEVPPELRRYASVETAMCGLVVFWTRVGW